MFENILIERFEGECPVIRLTDFGFAKTRIPKNPKNSNSQKS